MATEVNPQIEPVFAVDLMGVVMLVKPTGHDDEVNWFIYRNTYSSPATKVEWLVRDNKVMLPQTIASWLCSNGYARIMTAAELAAYNEENPP